MHLWADTVAHDPRAHTVLCEAIAFNGAPNQAVILHELRARVRGVLGRWAEAGEDVRVALKLLDQTDVVDIDSDEERMEVSNRPQNSTVAGLRIPEAANTKHSRVICRDGWSKRGTHATASQGYVQTCSPGAVKFFPPSSMMSHPVIT